MELSPVNHCGNRTDDRNVCNQGAAKTGRGGNKLITKSPVQRTLPDHASYSPAVSIGDGKQLESCKGKGKCEGIGKYGGGGKQAQPHMKGDDGIKAQTDAPLSSSAFIADFDDEISTGLPSDLPSDMFDIEGNLLYGNVHHLRFGLEDEDFSSADDENYHYHTNKTAQSGRKGNRRRETISSSQSPGKSHQKGFPQREREISVQSSAKFSPISTTCDTFTKTRGNVSFGENEIRNGSQADGEHLSCAAGASDNFEVDAPTEKKRVKTGRKHASLDKQNTMEDSLFQFHPLLINNRSLKGGPQYKLMGRRNLSLNQSSSSASNGVNNNTPNSSSSGGNFSPPSDHFRSPLAPFDRHHSSGGGSSSNNSSSTITQHYYPEGGWGYMILVTCTTCHVLTCGLQLSFCVLWNAILDKFGSELQLSSSWLGAVSLGISLLFSPVWVSICKKKSTRLSAVFGGLVASLGCLFTSFASQFHQTFISYGAFLGIGVGLTRDASSLMVGQYFKRKRELVEIIVVSGSGLGIILMSILVHTTIGSLGWRLGLQAVTVSLILTFFLGTCYRSASLYHPQRRAILHLKNQKRKVKEKGKREDKPPFIDCSCLRSKTLRIILMSSACTAFGIFTPLLSLAVQCSKKGFEDCSILLLHIYIGVSWIVGCCTLGLVVIQKSQDCRVSKQYLCQVASVICGISILALTAVKGTNGMVVFSWVYGASLGAYCYSLKVYTYERARARHFPRAYSFLQSSQAIPLFFGVPLTNYANEIVGWKSGYYMSALAVFLGTACLFLTDVRRRKLSRRKSQNSSMKTCETTDGGTSSPKSKRLSFAFPVDQQLPQQQSRHDSDDEDEAGGPIDPSVMIKELTCISEEGLADLDFQDIYFDDWAEYIEECITSCNKVENCLVSEFDPDLAMMVERRARRWSAAKQHHPPQSTMNSNGAGVAVGASAPTTGRLTLPGIGTVLEVPLLVAKRLHPGLGVRSHQHHPSMQHRGGGGGEDSCNGGCSGGGGGNGNLAAECNFSRGGNCAAAGTSSSSNTSPTTATRVYHHGKTRGSNLAISHFPAIDEDSV